MKKMLMMLGLITTSAAPLAASAHTDVHVGIHLGTPVYSYRVPAYYDYGRVVETRPFPSSHFWAYERYHARPSIHVDYRAPVIIYRETGRHSHRHHRGHGHRGRH